MDHLGPFVRSKNGNTHILTVVDAFTKYVFVRAVKDLKTKTTVNVLEKIFYDFGVPARLVSDRGTTFTSTAFQTFCNVLGIKHILNAVSCPRANGQAERFNQTILNSLSTQNFSGHEGDWDKCLGKIQWGINNTVNASTQKTATEAMFGIRLRDVLSNKLNTENYSSSNLELQQVREQIGNNIKKYQAKQKEKHDADRIPAAKYDIGDLVKISRNNFDNDKKSTKLLSKFVGPYKVTEVLGNDRYRITDVPGFNKKGKPYKTVIAADRIRPWIHIKALELHSSDETSSDDVGEK
ncbi:jg25094 [Pararge aegeria aegeria]|uniref:Jg25094 protein n=1 Tax=Pararge aegeria aegeria TaxID=348720 RepID=A0A8S4QN17_9NEOP|nr:jg25094 [Pararge aegeria aegeria]